MIPYKVKVARQLKRGDIIHERTCWPPLVVASVRSNGSTVYAIIDSNVTQVYNKDQLVVVEDR